MRIKNVVALLEAAIENKKPVLLVGAPGVGKTDIIRQAAQAKGADFMVSHPVVADPTDAKGLPWPDADKLEATFLPFGDLAAAIKAERPTVWLLDDLGQAPPAVQASYMQLLLSRRCNGHVISDYVTMIAASNRRTDRAGVSGMLEPVKSRFAAIVEVTPHIDDWAVWALENDIPASLIAFLRFRPELLSQFVPSADMTQSPTPRTWANLAEVESWKLPREVEAEAMAGAVGVGAATEYLAFRAMLGSVVTADQVILDPHNATLPIKAAECYAVCTALAAKADEKNFARITTYLQRLTDAGKGEFAIMVVRDAMRKTPALAHTAAWQKLIVSDLGVLIGGNYAEKASG
ncbi:MAG: ATP-binding protein [Patescibacteria group bacterium]|nr:ATP-binding protein [Patescibacteria group bacterium]